MLLTPRGLGEEFGSGRASGAQGAAVDVEEADGDISHARHGGYRKGGEDEFGGGGAEFVVEHGAPPLCLSSLHC